MTVKPPLPKPIAGLLIRPEVRYDRALTDRSSHSTRIPSKTSGHLGWTWSWNSRRHGELSRFKLEKRRRQFAGAFFLCDCAEGQLIVSSAKADLFKVESSVPTARPKGHRELKT